MAKDKKKYKYIDLKSFVNSCLVTKNLPCHLKTKCFYKMVRITEELLRKKSEHNECIISTLEELSLHQEDVEKIEHLNNWCKDLQILYLQANLISKIENLNKLKKLQYLNLALNNIEKIENLQGCESLEKLDLTLNFIGDIESIESLVKNIHLKDLYLTGNPCTDYKWYREYVIVKLPQLKSLDNIEINKSEKIKALQIFVQIEPTILTQQKAYKIFREEQKERLKNQQEEEIDDDEFWNKKSENAPEVRVEISKRSQKSKKENEIKPKKTLKLFAEDGRPLNINQAKLDFKFFDDNPNEFILDLAVYKYLDTNLIEVDLQPVFVKITIKGKVFQFVLPEEIQTDKSTAQRSQTSGHLVVKMPKARYDFRLEQMKKQEKLKGVQEKGKKIKPIMEKQNEFKPIEQNTKNKDESKHKMNEFLEVTVDKSLDFSRIIEDNQKKEIFKDNTDVPPLEYC